MNSVSGLNGGIIYAVDLLVFTASSNVFYFISLVAGKGDIFYLTTDTGDGITINMMNNDAEDLY